MFIDMKNLKNNFTIRIGRYFFDKMSMVGTLVGINTWDRVLQDEEMVLFTNCTSITEAKGNIINKNTLWHQTADLVEKYEIDVNEMTCRKEQREVPAFIPIRGLKNKKQSVQTCQKFGSNTMMAGEFTSEYDFSVFYNLLWSSQGKIFRDVVSVQDMGRIKIWLPYTLVKINGTKEAVHEKSKAIIGVDYWGHEKHGYLINKSAGSCLLAYMGVMPYKKNLLVDSYSIKNIGTSCLLQNSFEDTTTVKLRGLCHYTLFDQTYMVEYSK